MVLTAVGVVGDAALAVGDSVELGGDGVRGLLGSSRVAPFMAESMGGEECIAGDTSLSARIG